MGYYTTCHRVSGIYHAGPGAGPAICATSDGYIDRPHGTLALKGSLVPACGVNSMLSNIPLLGDIPYLGALFGNTSNSHTRTDLIILLTPHVARDMNELTDTTDELKLRESRRAGHVDGVVEVTDLALLDRGSARCRHEGGCQQGAEQDRDSQRSTHPGSRR